MELYYKAYFVQYTKFYEIMFIFSNKLNHHHIMCENKLRQKEVNMPEASTNTER